MKRFKPSSKNMFTDFQGGASFVDYLCYLCLVCLDFVSVHCCLVVTSWERTDLLALVCDVLLYFCHFLLWYPGSGAVLDYIDS